MLMPFGPYRGLDSNDLPSDYLKNLWLKTWLEEYYPHVFKAITETLLERDYEESHFFGCLKWDRYYERDH